MANVLKGEKLARLQWGLQQGWSTRAAARYAKVSHQTATRYVRLNGGRHVLCACGKRADHNGWCSWRYQQSAARQRFIQSWDRSHTKLPRRFHRRPNRQPATGEPLLWPFIVETPRDDHALLLAVNRAVPKSLPEQIRQDICQDVAVAVIGGSDLTPDLVRETLRAGQRKYRIRWDELSLNAFCSRGEFWRWEDVLSHDNPIERHRPQVVPIRRSTKQPDLPMRVKRGYTRGSESPHSKLTEHDVLAIRHAYHSGKFSQKVLGRIFGVSQATVYAICVGSTWKHVGGPIYMPDKDQFWVEALEAHGWTAAQGSAAWNKRSLHAGTTEGVERPPGVEDVAGSVREDVESLRGLTGSFCRVSPAPTPCTPARVCDASKRGYTAVNAVFSQEYMGEKEKPAYGEMSFSRAETARMANEFEVFWNRYPRKVGKLAAAKAYARARVHATADEILSGLERYNANLPDDMQYIAHASSWLNAGRWMDEYSELPRKRGKLVMPAESSVASPEDWFDECKRLHDNQCGGRLRHSHRMAEDAIRVKERAIS